MQLPNTDCVDSNIKVNSYDIFSSVAYSIWCIYWQLRYEDITFDNQLILDSAIKDIRKQSAH
ncbi:hypothetical protein HPULCUR_003777 [Helicostylum pulchrum]|uniref:Uncharacterized protein n=1 Tax=Helicostylum pulchrum TaxID=562976 RepID=A0ABP9XUB8_9FUNG